MPLVGCSDNNGGGGGSAGTGGSAGAGGTAGTGGSGGTPGTVPLIVIVFETNSISITDLGAGLEGVSVCEDGTGNCELTDDSGSATIMLPADRAIGYTMTKEGYISYLVSDVTDETFTGLSTNWPMFTESQIEEIAANLVIEYPLQGSWLALATFPRLAGATFDLVGETAKSYYNDESGVGQLDLTETTSVGTGGFLELSEGEHEVEFGGATANCTPAIAPDSDTANRITVTLRAGYTTYASMNCETP